MLAGQSACQQLRSLAAAVAKGLSQTAGNCSSSNIVQQASSRLPALLEPVLQRSAQTSRCSCSASSQRLPDSWHQLSRSLSRCHPQQALLLQQQRQHHALHSWQQQLWQQHPGGGLLLQARSMATRVEQQAAANPGKHVKLHETWNYWPTCN